MAKKVVTTTEFIDDLDGGKAEGTVSFAFDGQSYEIDLSKRNRAAMSKAFKPYIDAGRKSRAASRSSARRTTPARQDLGAIREWARANGHAVSDRGRVSQAIQELYDNAK